MIPTFEQVWNQYGHKVGKLAAQKAWAKVPPMVQIGIPEAIKNYWANKPEWQSPLHFSTFLNQQRYNDEYTQNEFAGIPREPDKGWERGKTAQELQKARQFWRANGWIYEPGKGAAPGKWVYRPQTEESITKGRVRVSGTG